MDKKEVRKELDDLRLTLEQNIKEYLEDITIENVMGNISWIRYCNGDKPDFFVIPECTGTKIFRVEINDYIVDTIEAMIPKGQFIVFEDAICGTAQPIGRSDDDSFSTADLDAESMVRLILFLEKGRKLLWRMEYTIAELKEKIFQNIVKDILKSSDVEQYGSNYFNEGLCALAKRGYVK